MQLEKKFPVCELTLKKKHITNTNMILPHYRPAARRNRVLRRIRRADAPIVAVPRFRLLQSRVVQLLEPSGLVFQARLGRHRAIPRRGRARIGVGGRALRPFSAGPLVAATSAAALDSDCFLYARI